MNFKTTQLSLILLFACFIALFSMDLQAQDAREPSPAEQQKAFFQNLELMCGLEAAGRTVFPEAGELDAALPAKDDFMGVDLKMIFTACAGDNVEIDFVVGDDWSRRWVIERVEDQLLLKVYEVSGKDREIVTLVQEGIADLNDQRAHKVFFAMSDLEQKPIGMVWKISLGKGGKVFSVSQKEQVGDRLRKTLHANFQLPSDKE